MWKKRNSFQDYGSSLIFYYKGRMYAFDIKVGKDKLSTEQKEFIAAITKHGGYGCEIRSLEEFKEKINMILNGYYLEDTI